MFRAVAVACLVFGLVFAVVFSRRAHAQEAPSTPASAPVRVRVAIECQQIQRTKACPAFLHGLVDEHAVLIGSPRAGADIVIYATATTVGQLDRTHLRFVGQGSGMPSPVELEVDLDTRASDDEQRAALAPVFRRDIQRYTAVKRFSCVHTVRPFIRSTTACHTITPANTHVDIITDHKVIARHQINSRRINRRHTGGRYLPQRRKIRAAVTRLK